MTSKIALFRIVRRPEGVNSPYPLLVVDGNGIPHRPLTTFYAKTQQALADGTAKTYLNMLLPFFNYVATDEWRLCRGDQWDSPPDAVQESVRDYLMYKLNCKVQRRETYEVVALTAQSPSTVRIFLAALKQFYHVMRWSNWYSYEHPLTDSAARLLREIDEGDGQRNGSRRRMPQISGVEEPITQYPSENYFRLKGDEWQVLPINDPQLPNLLVAHFEQARFCLRDQIIVRMAFETGARIREILLLTVGDWRARGCNQEAITFSKGSRGHRVKTIRFGSQTAKMLREYVNTERCTLDRQHRRLESLGDTDPLFLSQRKNPYDYAAFVPHWSKLCKAAQLDLTVHQLRHWHVTAAMKVIFETSTNSAEVLLRKEELVRYMAWRKPETLKVYEHFFNSQEYVKTQDQLLERLYNCSPSPARRSGQTTTVLQERPSEPKEVQRMSATEVKQTKDGWADLLALGGHQHG